MGYLTVQGDILKMKLIVNDITYRTLVKSGG
jgi:hypothetical protein